MRILDVGCGMGRTSPIINKEEGVEIVTVDIDPSVGADITHDIRNPFSEEYSASFDAVIASHVLEHIERLSILPVIKNLRNVLKDGGELHIYVPSLEWAAAELLREKPSNVIMTVIYGMETSEFQNHRCGFTLMMLRNVLEMSGLIPRRITQGQYELVMDGQAYKSTQNIAIAMRDKEFEGRMAKASDPSEALG